MPSDRELPRMGFGTWRMGESASRCEQDLEAIRDALEIRLRAEDLGALERIYPAPDRTVRPGMR